MHDKATSRHVPNKRQHDSREENSLGHYVSSGTRLVSKNVDVFMQKLNVFGHKTPVISTPLGSSTCVYKSGTHDFPHFLAPLVQKVTKTFLGRIIICCQEAASSLNWSVAAISLNLFRVVTTDMKYSSWISGLMWRELRSQSSSESVTVRGMFRLNPTRIANPSWMMA